MTDAPRYAFAFAVPVAPPGLRFICRQSLDSPGPAADTPLASRFEGMDAMAGFHEVVVPWDRVSLKGDPALCNGLFRQTPVFCHGAHQFTTKNLAKTEFVLGVVSLVAQEIGRTELPIYQMLLGEIVDVVQILRALMRAAEVDAVIDANGYYTPNPDTMATSRTYFPKIYPRLVEILQPVGSSGLTTTPTEADLAAPELAADAGTVTHSSGAGGRIVSIMPRL
jgi:4-hydroxyphenylacetate 3-monooxygenase